MAEQRPLSTVGAITTGHILAYTCLVCVDHFNLAGILALVFFWWQFKYLLWAMYSLANVHTSPHPVYVDAATFDEDDREWERRGTWKQWEEETC